MALTRGARRSARRAWCVSYEVSHLRGHGNTGTETAFVKANVTLIGDAVLLLWINEPMKTAVRPVRPPQSQL